MANGEDILESLGQAVTERGIRDALIVNGVGSVMSYHVHVVETTNLPPGNIFWKEENPFDIVSLTGLVMNGRVHAHIAVSDPERTVAGHLERGCRVLTFCIATLAILEDNEGLKDLDRYPVPGRRE
jgi:predicted DNA-binding protein with PD1-like motif